MSAAKNMLTLMGAKRELPVSTVSLNTARPFKKLHPHHVRCVALFVQGNAPKKIADTMGRSRAWVYGVIKNPACAELIQRSMDFQQDEIKALRGPAIDVVRDGMKLGVNNPSVALKAADMAFRLNNDFDVDRQNVATAEDVVSKLIAARKELHIKSDGPVEVTVIEQSAEIG